MGKVLILKPCWADLVLSGKKTLEIRGIHTKIRGTVGIAKSGTGQVFGTVEIVDSHYLTEADYEARRSEHRVGALYTDIPYRRVHGWTLKNPIWFETPRPYEHKQGCVIWVNVPDELLESR